MNPLELRKNYHDYKRLISVRAESLESGEMIIRGTPIVYDTETVLFKYGDKDVCEIIERGALDSADFKDVPLKYNHNDSKGTPASTRCKTAQGLLLLRTTEKGMEMEANLLPTSGGKDLFLEVKSGVISQMSFAFCQDRDAEIVEETTKKILFRVKRVLRIFDVSACDFGAYPTTEVYARRFGELDERSKHLDEMKIRALQTKIKILSRS